MMQLKQNMAVAAYEGARIGILPSSNSEAVTTQCEMLINDRGIQGCTVTLNPPVFTNMSVGDPLTVILTAEYSANSMFGGIFYENRLITESVVMLCE